MHGAKFSHLPSNRRGRCKRDWYGTGDQCYTARKGRKGAARSGVPRLAPPKSTLLAPAAASWQLEMLMTRDEIEA
ncbi:hypothetical protein E2C01_043630 [Portunus trituberculatus]|uniref:Uncharacterized protein n=1 Tax=Portunus trituberculatus TaxID=210409 RepID=A0A5B7FW76_PORTR|nr:hypothetical protein [Portunus trituberculatus]